jgi:hypothetical protein
LPADDPDEEAAVRRAGSDTDRDVASAIELNLRAGTCEDGKHYQVFLLSAPDDPETVRLARPVVSDAVSESGRHVAWTMGQRHLSLAALARPGTSHTSDLDSGDANRAGLSPSEP